jgi:hypothetical protein
MIVHSAYECGRAFLLSPVVASYLPWGRAPAWRSCVKATTNFTLRSPLLTKKSSMNTEHIISKIVNNEKFYK